MPAALPYTDDEKLELTETITDAMIEYGGLKQAYDNDPRSAQWPRHMTLVRWIYDDKPTGMYKLYARARSVIAERWASEILEISDDTSKDTYVDNDGNVRVDHENINRSRLKVDTRKWLLSKLRPKEYGEKVDVTSAGERVQWVIAMPTPDPEP